MAKKKPTPAPYPDGYEPFLAAIQANPADDVPRLVFADWLDEHDDPARAEFVRLQCEFTRWDQGGLSDFADEVSQLDLTAAEKKTVRRLKALFEANQDRWLAGFPAWVRVAVPVQAEATWSGFGGGAGGSAGRRLAT